MDEDMSLLIDDLRLAEFGVTDDYYFPPEQDSVQEYDLPSPVTIEQDDARIGDFLESNTWGLVQLIWYSVCVVFILVANALLLATIRKVKYLKTTLNRYVASLSVCDLVIALYALVKIIGLSIQRLGSNLYFCLGMHLGWICVSTIAQVMILYIAFDCYFSIWHPIGYARVIDSWKASVAIFLAWIYAGAVSLLPLIWFVKWTSSLCHVEELVESNYIIFLLVHYGVCVIIVVIVYLCVYYEIRTKKVILAVFQQRERQRQLYEDRRKRDVCNANCMAIMSLVHFVTWLPYFFVLAVHAFVVRLHVTALAEAAALMLAILHSSFNPLIYLCRLETFQIACYKVLCCCPGQDFPSRPPSDNIHLHSMSFRNHVTGSMMSLHTALDGKMVRLPRGGITTTSSSSPHPGAEPSSCHPADLAPGSSNELWLTPGTSHMGLEGVVPGESTSTTPYITARTGNRSQSPSYTHDLPVPSSPYSKHIPLPEDVGGGIYEEMGDVMYHGGDENMTYPGEVYHRNAGEHIISPVSTLHRNGGSSASVDSYHNRPQQHRRLGGHLRNKSITTVYASPSRLPRFIQAEYSSPKRLRKDSRSGGLYTPRTETSKPRVGTEYASPVRRSRRNSRSKSASDAGTPGSRKGKALRGGEARGRRDSDSEEATYH